MTFPLDSFRWVVWVLGEHGDLNCYISTYANADARADKTMSIGDSDDDNAIAHREEAPTCNAAARDTDSEMPGAIPATHHADCEMADDDGNKQSTHTTFQDDHEDDDYHDGHDDDDHDHDDVHDDDDDESDNNNGGDDGDNNNNTTDDNDEDDNNNEDFAQVYQIGNGRVKAASTAQNYGWRSLKLKKTLPLNSQLYMRYGAQTRAIANG